MGKYKEIYDSRIKYDSSYCIIQNKFMKGIITQPEE